MDLLPTQPHTPSSPESETMPLKRSISSVSLKRDIPDNLKAMVVPTLPDDLEIPPLPVIQNRALEEQVSTHSSALGQVRTRVTFGEGDVELQDNEKLEWVGDGILSTCMIINITPQLQLTRYRSSVYEITAPTMAQYERRSDNGMLKPERDGW